MVSVYFDVVDVFQSNSVDFVDSIRSIDFSDLPKEIDLECGDKEKDHFDVTIVMTQGCGK